MWTVPTIQFRGCVKLIGITESDVKEIIKKQLENAPNGKDDEKIQNDANNRINTTDVDLAFSCINLSLKLSLKLVESKWEKVIILRLLLTPRAWRVVVVSPHFILVSVIINYTNMVATSHVKLGFLNSKVNFCWIWTLSWRKN